MRVALLISLGACLNVSAASPAFSQVPPVSVRITEAEALRRLSGDDPRVRALRARVDEVRAAQSLRAVRPNPTITFSREKVGDAHDDFILGRQEIDVSGRWSELRRAGALAVEAAEADARHQTVQLQAFIRRVHTDLLLAQEREAAVAAALDGFRQLLEVLRARESAGEGSRYDRIRGQRALVDLEAELGAATAARIETQGILSAIFASPGGALMSADGALDVPGAPPDVAALVEQAIAGRGDLKALVTSAEQHRAEGDAANRLALPTPTFTGGLKRSALHGDGTAGYLFSVDLSVPLFNRGQQAAALATSQTAGADARATVLRRQIEVEVHAAHAAAEVHRRRIERYRASAGEAVDSLLAVARLGYEEGELGILELLDAARQSLEGRLKGLELAASARRAVIELDRIVGLEIRP
jgi:cobalt-zinc-cadmium efflux system outer membrane protein